MTVVTLLDAAHAALTADPENETLRLRFFERLADGEMFLLLDREAEGETLDPRIFPLESGPVVLVFDREERLAEFSGGIAPYAALPGRVIAAQLAGQGIGLGVNLGVAPSSILLPAEAMDWLAGTLDGGPEETSATPEELLPARAPAVLVEALAAKLALMPGLAAAAVLAGVRWQGGRRGHVLGLIGAAPAAQPGLARAVREALVFSGIEAGELDVIFPEADSPLAATLLRIGRDIALPAAGREAGGAPVRQGPGTDPAKPPRLR